MKPIMATRLSERAKRRWRKRAEKRHRQRLRKQVIRCLLKQWRLSCKARNARKKQQKAEKRQMRRLKKPASQTVRRRDSHGTCAKCLWMAIVLILFGVSARLAQAFAASLGTEGAIYAIVEPDLLAGIAQTLQLKIDNGEWDKWQREWQLRTKAKSERPDPVVGVSDLPAEQSPRVWVFNPTVTVNRDITVMRQGKRVTLATQGERLNPLSVWPLKETLLFINGDNAAQMDWLKREFRHAPKQPDMGSLKIILVRGNVKTTASTLQHRVYFDQFGALCQRFGITHTPTRVVQARRDGKKIARLQLEEIRVE